MEKWYIRALPLVLILAAVGVVLLLESCEQKGDQFAEAHHKDQEGYLQPGEIIFIPGQAQKESALVYAGAPMDQQKRIALTFDSGWIAEYTPALLDILRAEEVLATFFHRGKWAEVNPELVRQMGTDGHLIGNHSYTHPYMDKLSPSEVLSEVEKASEVLQSLIGYRPWLYRPPYGSCTPAIRKTLSELGYTYSIMWSIDTHDWKDPGVNYIVRRVLDNARDGAIVLMHVGAGQTVEALPEIIEGLRSKGFEFVLVDELLPLRASANGLMPYRTREGDTLQNLASAYGIEVKELLVLNPSLNLAP